MLALLPTMTTNILEAMNTEQITYEIQQMKGPAAKGAGARQEREDGEDAVLLVLLEAAAQAVPQRSLVSAFPGLAYGQRGGGRTSPWRCGRCSCARAHR